MKKIKIPKKQLKKFYIEDDMTAEEVAKIYNCDRATIMNRVKKYKIHKNIGYIIPKKELIKLRNQGKTLKEIANFYRCSTGTIDNRIKEYGLQKFNHEKIVVSIKELNKLLEKDYSKKTE